MLKPEKFSIRKRLNSFLFAFSGVRFFFRNEHNAWIHAVAAVIVLTLSFILKLSQSELISIVFCIGFVWSMEMVNTAIEKLMDHLSPARHPEVKVVKDIAAAAVLTATIVAVIVGSIIFIPKII